MDDEDDYEAIILEQQARLNTLEYALARVQRELAEARAEIVMLKQAMAGGGGGGEGASGRERP